MTGVSCRFDPSRAFNRMGLMRPNAMALTSTECCLTNPLDDFPRSVAAFARLVGRLARRFVDLFAGSVALRADIFAGAGRSGLRIIVGGVVSKWILGLHGLRPVVHSRTGKRKSMPVGALSRGLSSPAPRPLGNRTKRFRSQRMYMSGAKPSRI